MNKQNAMAKSITMEVIIPTKSCLLIVVLFAVANLFEVTRSLPGRPLCITQFSAADQACSTVYPEAFAPSLVAASGNKHDHSSLLGNDHDDEDGDDEEGDNDGGDGGRSGKHDHSKRHDDDDNEEDDNDRGDGGGSGTDDGSKHDHTSKHGTGGGKHDHSSGHETGGGKHDHSSGHGTGGNKHDHAHDNDDDEDGDGGGGDDDDHHHVGDGDHGSHDDDDHHHKHGKQKLVLFFSSYS